MHQRHTRVLTVAGLAALLLPAVAMGQVTDESLSNQNDVNVGAPPAEGSTVVVPYDNGIVDRRSGLHIEALNPTTADGDGDGIFDDAQAHALVNAENRDATRKAWVALGIKTGANTYVVRGQHEYDWNNSGTNGLQPKDGDPIDCAPGGAVTVVTLITGKRQGDSPRTDRSQEVTLPLSTC